jgi:hypothetical protein
MMASPESPMQMICCERFEPVIRSSSSAVVADGRTRQVVEKTLPAMISCVAPASPTSCKKRTISDMEDSDDSDSTMKKRSVRFQEPKDMNMQKSAMMKKKRKFQRRSSTKVEGEVSSTTNDDSSSSTWNSKNEFMTALRSTEDLAMHFVSQSQLSNTAESELAEVISTTFASCCLDHNFSQDVTDSLTHHLIRASASQKQDYRGLERASIVSYGQESMRRRKEVIGSVLSLQLALKTLASPPQEKNALISTMYEQQTRPSRRFANCMAQVDAMCALVVYRTESSHSSSSSTREEALLNKLNKATHQQP